MRKPSVSMRKSNIVRSETVLAPSGVLSSFKAACPTGTIYTACATAVEIGLEAAIVSATTGAEVSR